MKLIIVGKKGALTEYRVVGGEQISSEISDVVDYPTFTDGADIVGATNKKSIAALRDFLQRHNAAQTNSSRKSNKRKRYITLASMAKNGGKSWRATGFDIDKHSLSPEWEGELICYEYGD